MSQKDETAAQLAEAPLATPPATPPAARTPPVTEEAPEAAAAPPSPPKGDIHAACTCTKKTRSHSRRGCRGHEQPPCTQTDSRLGGGRRCGPPCCCAASCSCRRQGEGRSAGREEWGRADGTYRRCQYCMPERDALEEAELLERQYRCQNVRAEHRDRVRHLADTTNHAAAYRRTTSELLRASQSTFYQRAIDLEYHSRRRELQAELTERRERIVDMKRRQDRTPFVADVYPTEYSYGRACARPPPAAPRRQPRCHSLPYHCPCNIHSSESNSRAEVAKPRGASERYASRHRETQTRRPPPPPPPHSHHKHHHRCHSPPSPPSSPPRHCHCPPPRPSEPSCDCRCPPPPPPPAHQDPCAGVGAGAGACGRRFEEMGRGGHRRHGPEHARCCPRCSHQLEVAHHADVVAMLAAGKLYQWKACPACGFVAGKPAPERRQPPAAEEARAAAREEAEPRGRPTQRQTRPSRSSSSSLQAPQFGRKVFITDDVYLNERAKRLTEWEESGRLQAVPGERSPSAPLPERTPKWKTLSDDE